MIDKDRLKKYGLELFRRDVDNIENQYLNLIYDPSYDHVVERWVYEKTVNMIPWKCAICHTEILSDRERTDAENFVCEKCRENHNNNNLLIDRRIMDSRTLFYKDIEKRIYEELEDDLKRRM